MEAVELSPSFWRGKRVLLTGHTGFKGGWLALWLQSWGAQVSGFALQPSTSPSLFELARVGEGIDSHIGDLRDLAVLQKVMAEVKPEIVLHLAAQPLVREGYRDPLGTYASNVMGTLHLLEVIRQTGGVKACVLVTTDKVYANNEWAWPYRESEALGGHDPYSSSKACCELVAQSFAASYFPAARYAEHGLAMATARAGNVLGGGDFAPDRLLPDILAAWTRGEPKSSTRSWVKTIRARSFLCSASASRLSAPSASRPCGLGSMPWSHWQVTCSWLRGCTSRAARLLVPGISARAIAICVRSARWLSAWRSAGRKRLVC